MKIRTKFLGIVYVYSILFAILILGFAYYQHRLTSKSVNDILNYQNELEIVSQLELTLVRVVMPANDYLIHGDKEERYTFDDLDAEVNKLFEMLEGKYFATRIMVDERELLYHMKGQYVLIKTLSEEILNLPDPIGNAEGACLMEEMDLLVDNMLEDMKAFHRSIRLVVLREIEVIDVHFSRYIIIMLSILSIVIITSFFYGLFLTKGIIVSIGRLVEYMGFVAKGDFSQRLDIKTKDEIGFLSNSLKKMTEDLQKTTVSKEYVNNIIKSMIDTLIVVNPDATIRTVNHATLDLLGYKEDELIGKSVGIIFEEKEEILSLKGKGIAELLKKGFVANVEKRYLSKDARKIPVLFSGSVMCDDNGNIQGIVCVALNITERKRAEEELKKKTERLERFHKITVGREFDMVRLKEEVNTLLEKLGIPKKYKAPDKMGKVVWTRRDARTAKKT